MILVRATSFLKFKAYSTRYSDSISFKADFNKRIKEIHTLKAYSQLEGFVPKAIGFELKAA